LKIQGGLHVDHLAHAISPQLPEPILTRTVRRG